MKKLAFALTALGLLAAAPASAQEFRLRAGPDGVTVRGGDDDRYDRRRVIERRVYRDGPRSYRPVAATSAAPSRRVASAPMARSS